MFLTIHQPEFMPWAAYFEKMLRTDHFVILDSTKYQKSYFLNRCRIKQQGEAKWLTVPVNKGSSAEIIAEKRLADQDVWGKKIFHALYYNYGRAPYWSAHEDFFEHVFQQAQWTRLIDLNLKMLEYFSSALEIPFNYTRSIDMDLCETGSDLVLEICKKMGADQYLSGAHGKEYLDEAPFQTNGVEIIYQHYEERPYEQFNGAYCGPLSIVDLLLNKGPEARRYIALGAEA